MAATKSKPTLEHNGSCKGRVEVVAASKPVRGDGGITHHDVTVTRCIDCRAERVEKKETDDG